MQAPSAYHALMRKAAKKPYILQSIPIALDRALRQRARRERKSLNEVALEALRRGLGFDASPVVYHDLDHLIGSWKENPAIDEALADQDRVDTVAWVRAQSPSAVFLA